MSKLLKKVAMSRGTKASLGGLGTGAIGIVIWAFATFAEKSDCRETRIELQTLRETVSQLLWAMEHEVQFTTAVRAKPRKVIDE